MMEGMESKSILGVRIDNFNNNFEDILERLKNKENALIVTLDIHQLLRVRSNKKLRETVNNASLVIAVLGFHNIRSIFVLIVHSVAEISRLLIPSVIVECIC